METEQEKSKKSLTKEEKSWILYDVANSSFILIIVTTVMPIFFKDVASRGISDAVSTANWGFANSVASFILAAAAPVIGAFADYRNYKKRFFTAFLSAGVCFTLLLTTVDAGSWFACLVYYVAAKFAYSGANLFYDAFLVDVAEKKRMDWISSCGYAWGYIGGTIPFLAVIGVILYTMSGSGSTVIPVFSVRFAFVAVSLWWGLLSIPMLKNVRQIYFIPHSPNPIRETLARLVNTFRQIREYKNAFLFLLAYFFYIDGVDTIITMATAYGRDIGLGTVMLITVVLMIQIVAFPFALLYGWLSKRFSAKLLLFCGIGVYATITLASFFLPSLPTHEMRVTGFWILAFFVATSQGGIQALSRSFFGKLIPPRCSAEFFGFYNVFGKFAAITGPFLMGIVTRMTGHSRFGTLSLLILFIAGGLLLARVKEAEPGSES
ncbi:MAG: MFS transporter [Thermodesulfobacteriota bacterium]